MSENYRKKRMAIAKRCKPVRHSRKRYQGITSRPRDQRPPRNFFTRHLDPWTEIRQHTKSYKGFTYEVRFRQYSFNNPFEDIIGHIRTGIGKFKINMNQSRRRSTCWSMSVFVKTEAELLFLKLCGAEPSIIYRLVVEDQPTLH
jgi:hypothetical protein